MIVYYAQKIVELVGAEEQPRQWVLDNLVPIENDAENNGDSLADFIRCLQVLEGKDAIGSWDKRLFTDENGVRWIAIHAASVWTEVQKAFQPATYNQKSLKAQLLKIGGQVNKSVRFHSSRDEVLAYKRAILTAKYDLEGNLIQPNPPQKKMKKAWLIPLHLFDIEPDIDPDTEPPDRTPDNNPGDGSGSPDGDGSNTSAETVLKLNSFSPLDNVATSISGCELSFRNPETNVAKESNLYGSAGNSELPTIQVYTAQNSGEAVLSPEVMKYPGPPTETLLVSQSSTESVEQKTKIEDTPRAVTLRRANGSLIPLPADYPGDRSKEPHQIAELLLAIQCKADWKKIVNKYGETCTLWVWRWCFNQAQRLAVAEIISGQSVTHKLPIVQNQTDYYRLVELSDRAGYLCQKSDGLVLACYLGFNARAEAEAAYSALIKLGFDHLEIRVAKRLRKCRLQILIRYPNFAQWRRIAIQPPFNCRATD